MNITVFDMSLDVCNNCSVDLEAVNIDYEIPAYLYSLFKCDRALVTMVIVKNKGKPD